MHRRMLPVSHMLVLCLGLLGLVGLAVPIRWVTPSLDYIDIVVLLGAGAAAIGVIGGAIVGALAGAGRRIPTVLVHLVVSYPAVLLAAIPVMRFANAPRVSAPSEDLFWAVVVWLLYLGVSHGVSRAVEARVLAMRTRRATAG